MRDLVTEVVIATTGRSQSSAVDRDRPGVIERQHIEVPHMRSEHPRPAEHLARMHGGDHQRVAPGGGDFDGEPAFQHEVKGVGRAAAQRDPCARRVLAEARHPHEHVDVRRRQAVDEAVGGNAVVERGGGHRVPPVRAIASSTMSMPAGHQVVHRPQPTQPSVPNCSGHVCSLCVSH